MKICHVTFTHTSNYGSCFQAYALDEVLKSLGHESYQCNYQIELIERMRARGILRAKDLVKFYLISIFERPSFHAFEKTRIKYTRLLENTREEYEKLGKEYDAYISGSDVIWNTNHNRRKEYFYLDFTDKYKFSYAASFGKGKLNENDERLAKQYLPELDAISVREESSAVNARRFTEKPVEVVADPVLLLGKDEWLSIAELPTKKNYILVYTTSIIESQDQFAKLLKKRTHKEVVWISWSSVSETVRHCAFKYPSPEQWLGLLNGADYIVTNSFHATAFSVLFHKTFFSFVNRDKREGNGSRLYDFLERFDLGDRIFSECPSEIDLSEPDFSKADAQIAEMKEKSMAFLRKNLDAAEQRLRETDTERGAENGRKMAAKH